ncbi:MAG: hypothetical protein L0H84_15010, partial [Pseudonocardia sp.]|nr:hypothetical protein [Pseudonocardia sp.]
LVVALDDPLLVRFGDRAELARLRAEFGDSTAPIPAERIGSLVDDAVTAAQQAAERNLRRAIRGRTSSAAEFVRVLDERPTGRAGAQEPQLTQLTQRIGGLQRQLATGRGLLVRSLAAGVTAPELRAQVSDLQASASQLAGLVREYRSVADTLDGPAAPAAPVQVTAERDRAVAELLGVDAATIRATRDLIVAGDLDGALTAIRRTATGAHAMASIPGLWAGADVVFADAQQVVTALHRTLAAPGRRLGGAEARLVGDALGRLEVLVTTVPGGAAAQALDATRGTGVVPQLAGLARLRSTGTPDRVVRDLADLVEARGLTIGDLAALAARVAGAGRAQAAAVISEFAAGHGLAWSRTDRRGLLAALRDLPRTELARWREHAAAHAAAHAAMRAAAGTVAGMPPGDRAPRRRAWLAYGAAFAGAAAGAGGLALAGVPLGAPVLVPATIGAVLITAAVRAPRSANPARAPPAGVLVRTGAVDVARPGRAAANRGAAAAAEAVLDAALGARTVAVAATELRALVAALTEQGKVTRLDTAVEEIAALLEADRAALRERIEVKRAAAAAAYAEVDAALDAAITAAGQDDRGAAERSRKATAAAEIADAKWRRLVRSVAAYATAGEHADTAATGFAVVREILAAIARDPGGPGVAALVADAHAYTREAADAVDAYRAALVDTVPAVTAAPTGFPIGELPAIARVAEAANRLLSELGSRQRMTELEIGDLVRSRFDAVAVDGLLISTGGVELLLRLGVDWMVEDMTPGPIATEVIQGSIPQGGRSSTAGAHCSGGMSATADLTALAAMVPSGGGVWGLLTSIAANGWKATFSATAGRSEGTSGGGYGYVVPGGVADNRGDGIALRAGVTYRITARSAALPQGRTVTVRSSGGQDSDVLRLWVSHTYSANAPPALAPARKRSGELPQHAPLTATGLNELAGAVSDALGAAGRIGSPTRDQVRVLIADDLPGRLRGAVDGPHGLEWMLHDEHGREIAVLRVRTAVLGGRIVGVASRKEHLEDLFVLFSGASGSLSSTRSIGVAGGIGLLVDTAAAWFGVSTGLAASWSRTRSTGAHASAVAIHPAVHRFSGHTVAELVDLVHTAEIEWLDGTASPATVTRQGTALLRMSEGAAHRFGLPVDADAVLGQRADGTPVLRDDLDPAPPAGRRGELPSWIGASGIRGFGHGLVRELTGMG